MFDHSRLFIVPKLSGIYIWKNINKKILYIGKARNLNIRMNQYFSNHNMNSYMTSALVSEIDSFEYIITKDEKDALILESNLIKQHKPKYNILLIDDKSHRFIRIKLSKNNIDICMKRRFTKDRAIYFGPFPQRHNTRNIINLLNRIAKFHNGLPVYNKDYKYWKDKYDLCLRILNPRNKKLLRELKNKMLMEASRENFELANDYKQILKSLEFYCPKTIVELTKNINQDIWGIYKKNNYYSIYIMFYRDGKLLSIYSNIIKNNMIETLRNYIRIYYESNICPDEIYIESKYIAKNDLNINIINPKIARGIQVIKMANKNAKDNFDNKLNKFKKNEEIHIGAIKIFGEILDIPIPKYIIMIDNSMTNNTNPVSGIVVYRYGIKQPHEYIKYNLKISKRKSDVDYMRQVFTRYWAKHKNNLPDLLIVDGGKQQVSEIKKIIIKNKINLNFIGLVKNKKHQTRGIINSELKEIKISSSKLLIFLATMQIEVDRFAKSHHRNKRRQSSFEGKLLSFKGIGIKTENKLIDHFHTYSNIYNASQDELEKVISKKLAINIKNNL